MKRGSLVAVLAASVATACCHIALAGNPTPPVGPVTGTMKTLDQVEPRVLINSVTTPGDAASLFRISAPGSYYLTGNVQGVAGKHGIKIDATDVTLDLMGFRLVGAASSLDGVVIDLTVANRKNITIRNGVITGWGQDGVGSLSTKGGGDAAAWIIESIVASSNTGTGIFGSFSGAVRNCTANSNGGAGINANGECVVESCETAQNAGVGLAAVGGAVLRQCVSSFNTGTGISVTNDCRVADCTSTYNSGLGMFVSQTCAVSGCTIDGNGGDGISASFACRITDCQVSFNFTDGIELQNECQVIGNTCYRNGSGGNGAGIHASGFYNRIESNTVSNNTRGIDVDMFDNIIIRNTARANTVNYDIVTSNIVGIVVAVPHSGAILGNSGGAGVGTTDPAANYAY